MADEGVANGGGGGDDQYGEESATKIVAWQRKCDESVTETVEWNEEIKNLTAELNGSRSDGADKSEKIEELSREVEQLRDSAKANARAADRMKGVYHDMLKMNAALTELMKVYEERKSRVDSLEKKLAGLKKEMAEASGGSRVCRSYCCSCAMENGGL